MTKSRKSLASNKVITNAPLAPLLKQPKDILHLQAKYLDTKTLANLARVQKHTVTLFKKPLAKRLLKKLLQHVVRGEQRQAEDIIKKQPKMLLEKETVKDYSGRTLKNVSPITAAYGAEDADMLEMMFKYLDEVAKKEARNQIKDKFPEQKESKSYDFRPLVAAFTARKNVKAAIDKFQKDFTPGVIEEGKHFPMQILLDAYQLHADHCNHWRDANLLFQQIIGYLQSLLPACYAQALCQGIHSVVFDDKPLRRSLGVYPLGDFYYPVEGKRKLNVLLGCNAGLYSILGDGQGEFSGGVYPGGVLNGDASRLKMYADQKQRRLEKLCSEPSIEQSNEKQGSRKRPRASIENS